jgi:Regulatory CLIP domain of proteinases
VNPQNAKGLCISLQSCGFLLNILQKYPYNEQANLFVRQSICGYDRRTRQEYACCPVPQQQQQQQQLRPQPQQPPAQERNLIRPASGAHQFQQQTLNGSGSQFQQQTQSAKSLLPKCTFDLNNRIFGGVRSSISDFGFLVLLRYSKSNLNKIDFI